MLSPFRSLTSLGYSYLKENLIAYVEWALWCTCLRSEWQYQLSSFVTSSQVSVSGQLFLVLRILSLQSAFMQVLFYTALVQKSEFSSAMRISYFCTYDSSNRYDFCRSTVRCLINILIKDHSPRSSAPGSETTSYPLCDHTMPMQWALLRGNQICWNVRSTDSILRSFDSNINGGFGFCTVPSFLSFRSSHSSV